jgi:hypothetical protein
MEVSKALHIKAGWGDPEGVETHFTKMLVTEQNLQKLQQMLEMLQLRRSRGR